MSTLTSTDNSIKIPGLNPITPKLSKAEKAALENCPGCGKPIASRTRGCYSCKSRHNYWKRIGDKRAIVARGKTRMVHCRECGEELPSGQYTAGCKACERRRYDYKRHLQIREAKAGKPLPPRDPEKAKKIKALKHAHTVAGLNAFMAARAARKSKKR